MKFGSLHHAGRTLVAAFLALAGVGTAPGQLIDTMSESIDSVTITSGLYVIASDATNGAAGYDRDTIEVEAEVRYWASSTMFPGSGTYWMRYELLRPDDSAVLLDDGSGGTTASVSSSQYGVSSANPSDVKTRTETIAFAPAEQLDPQVAYRVRATLRQDLSNPPFVNIVTADTADSAPRTFIHFANTVSADLAPNYHAVVDSGVQILQGYLVETASDPSQRVFRARVRVDLHRYDGFAGLRSTAFTPITIDAQLRESGSGQIIAVGQATTVVNVAQWNYDLDGAVKVPAVIEDRWLEFEFAPAEQLVSGGELYIVAATVTHAEGATSRGSGTWERLGRFLHFNGRFLASDIEASIVGLPSAPTNLTAVDPELDCTLTTVELRLNGFPERPVTGGPIDVRLLANGDAVFTGGTPLQIAAPPDGSDSGEINGIRTLRAFGTLSPAGAQMLLTIVLPAGMGVTNTTDLTTKTYAPVLPPVTVEVDGNLDPTAGSIVFEPAPPLTEPFLIVEETKPVGIITPTVTWNLPAGELEFDPTGVRYVHRTEIEALAATPGLGADNYVVRSNDGYYLWADAASSDARVGTTAEGTAALTAQIDIAPGTFSPHFPSGPQLAFAGGGVVTVQNGRLDTAESRLIQASPVTLDYTLVCEEALALGCDPGGADGIASVGLLTAPGDDFELTADGGLLVSGPLDPALRRDLVWGYIGSLATRFPDSPYVHDTSDFDDVTLLTAGHFLCDHDLEDAPFDGPSSLLLSGFSDPGSPERPGTGEYLAGFGDYPGFNYRAGGLGIRADSLLGGIKTGEYPLTPSSKFYVRRGGVSGKLQPADFPQNLPMMGYDLEFDTFALSYLDSEVHRSLAAGSLAVPFPARLNLDFENMMFSCLGAPSTFALAGGPFDTVLDYWQADLRVQAAEFRPQAGNECDPSEGFLATGVQAHASNVNRPLLGVLGIRNTGSLVTAADGIGGEIDSRLSLPNNVTLRGPKEERYRFRPLHDAWFNDFELRDPAEPSGYINLAGKLDVAYFADIRAHLQLSARRNDELSIIHLTSGWTDPGGDDLLSSPEFDLAHRGRPPNVDLATYRQTDSGPYLPHARQNLFGLIPLNYTLSWDTTTRSFSSAAPVSNDFFVVSAEHQVRHLSADNAEVDFGATYEGVPEVNLSNIAVDLLGETGVYGAIADTIGGLATDALVEGLEDAANILSDRMEESFDRVFAEEVDPILDDLYAEWQAIENGTSQQTLTELLDEKICDPSDSVFAVLRDLGNIQGGQDLGVFLEDLDTALARLQIAIRAIIGRVEQVEDRISLETGYLVDPADIAGGADQTLEGIFYRPDGAPEGEYDRLKAFIAHLLENIDPGLADALSLALDTSGEELEMLLDDKFELGQRLAQVSDAIETIREILLDAHNRIQEIRDNNDLPVQIATSIAEVIADLQTELENEKDAILAELSNLSLGDVDAEAFKAMVRTRLRDVFNESLAFQRIQRILRHTLQDLHDGINEAIDSGFQNINVAIRAMVEEFLPDVDQQINGFLGDLDDKLGSANIDGYAHINGDTVRHLRLDAMLQLKVPDDFEFNGFLEINQWDSDGTDTCLFVNGQSVATEVIIGAERVPVSWIGEDTKFDIYGKFTFDSQADFALRGLGGGIDMTDGAIEFETFKINDLGADVMFGADENYLAAQLGLEFEGFELEGGIFFGRTCTIDPLAMVNEDVATVLGEPPFTGAYVFGRAHIPIINAGCLFRISAGAGAGAFYFAEGPTYGGQMEVSASGEALCILTIRGEVVLIGLKRGDDFRFQGTGRFSGKVGWCPFCVKFGKSVTLTYKNGGWSYDF